MYNENVSGILSSTKNPTRAPDIPGVYRTACAFIYLIFAILVFQSSAALAQGGAVPHPNNCADDEIYISSQDWWLTTPGQFGEDGLPGEEFGHLHTELCFPHKSTITGEMTLDVTSIMHHNPGDFYKLVIQIWASGWEPDPLICGEGSAVACREFDPPRTLASCESSGGTLIGEATCKWQDSLTFDTGIFPYDGWQQWRVRGKVDQADGSSMRTSTGLHAYLSNGKPVNHVYENPDRLEGRGWYTDANYAVSNVKGLTAAPVSGYWAPWVEMKQGADGIPVTSHRVALDAAIHAGNPGTELLDAAGPYEGRVMIDTRELSNGWHKLFLRTSQFEPISASTNSSVFVALFEVLNQQPPACDLNYAEPAVADAYVRGDSYQDDNFGDDDELIVKSSSSDYYTRRAYLQFDLGGFAATNVSSAVFTAQVNYHQTPGVAVPLKLYSVDSDSWGEDTISWSNEPAPHTLLGVVNVVDVGPVSFDISSHVEAELAGDKTVSLVLVDDSGTNQMLRLRSRSVENDPPVMVLVPATIECTPSGEPPPEPPPVPDDPSAMTVTDVTVDQVDLAWTDNANDELGQEIQRRTEGNSWSPLTEAGANVSSYSDTAVIADTSYDYSVRAFNDDGVSGWSNTVSVTTPPGPSGFTLSANGSIKRGKHIVDLYWSGANGNKVDPRRDGSLLTKKGTSNDGHYQDRTGNRGTGTYNYQVCESETSVCSNVVTVAF